MSAETGKQSISASSENVNVWRAVHGDSHRPLMGADQIEMSVTSTTFTVLEDTMFYTWGTESFTSPATPATNNNSYPNSTSITYLNAGVVFESADQVITPGTTSGFSGSNATYYVYVSANDVDASGRGKGVYSGETDAPTYSLEKRGMYHATHGKCVARYVIASSVITEFMIYKGPSKVKGHADFTIENTSTTVVVKQPIFDLNGVTVEYLQDVTLTASGGAEWKSVMISESVGAISLGTLSTYSTGLSGNQLDMDTIYDHDKKYCDSAGLRIFAIANWSGSALTNCKPVPNRPKSLVKLKDSSAQSVAHATQVVISFDAIDIDINSEWDTVNDYFNPVKSGDYTLSSALYSIDLTGSAVNENMHERIIIAGVGTLYGPHFMLDASQTAAGCGIDATINAVGSFNTLSFAMFQNSGNSLTLYNNVAYNWATIGEV